MSRLTLTKERSARFNAEGVALEVSKTHRLAGTQSQDAAELPGQKHVTTLDLLT